VSVRGRQWVWRVWWCASVCEGEGEKRGVVVVEEKKVCVRQAQHSKHVQVRLAGAGCRRVRHPCSTFGRFQQSPAAVFCCVMRSGARGYGWSLGPTSWVLMKRPASGGWREERALDIVLVPLPRYSHCRVSCIKSIHGANIDDPCQRKSIGCHGDDVSAPEMPILG